MLSLLAVVLATVVAMCGPNGFVRNSLLLALPMWLSAYVLMLAGFSPVVNADCYWLVWSCSYVVVFVVQICIKSKHRHAHVEFVARYTFGIPACFGVGVVLYAALVGRTTVCMRSKMLSFGPLCLQHGVRNDWKLTLPTVIFLVLPILDMATVAWQAWCGTSVRANSGSLIELVRMSATTGRELESVADE